MSLQFRLGRLSVYANRIARGNNGSDPSWRGYCWGSDWPGARFSRSPSCRCLDLFWLMFFVSIYWNERPRDKSPKTHKDRRDKSAEMHKDEATR